LYIIIKDILNILYLFKLSISIFINVLFYLRLAKILYEMFYFRSKDILKVKYNICNSFKKKE